MSIAFLWTQVVLQTISDFIVSVSVATFYFSNEKRSARIKEAKVEAAWNIAYMSHFGSIVLGSHNIFLCRIIKYTLVLLMQIIAVLTFDTCQCSLLDPCEELVEQMDYNAYHYIAVTGDSFYHGSVQSMYLRAKFMAEVASDLWNASMYIFLCKLSLIVVNLAVFWYISVCVT